MPLILRSDIKKVITISTGFGDSEMMDKFSVANAVPYSVSKGATNLLVTKYNSAYKE
jgi:dTDP-D-glucose 4,6-dehydratase